MYFKGIQQGKLFIFFRGFTQSRGGMTPIFFCGSCYNIQFKPYATSNMALFVIKKGNSWKLLLTFVTLSFILNVTGLLDTTLKCIDKVIKIYIKAISIPSAIYLLKVRKKNTSTECQIYSKLTFGASIVNFENVPHFMNIAEFNK